jgi:carboxypeptidase PM20D1
MMGYVAAGLGIALLVFVAVVLVRTLLFKPEAEAPLSPAPLTLNRDKIVEDMADMIRCKTV